MSSTCWPGPARVLLAILLLGAATGCGEHEAASALSVPRAPIAGGTLRLVQERPASLDPIRSDSVYEAFPNNQLFDGLVAIGPGLTVEPGLASTWKIDPGGRDYLFNLREDARFHDGGPVTAEDVVFTFRRVLAPGRTRRSLVFSYLMPIEGAPEFANGISPDLPGVAAIDPHTVRIRLSRPYTSFLEVLAMDGVRVVPHHVLEAVGEEAFARSPVGSGPFRFEAWTPDGIALVANRDYFGPRPYLDRVEIRFFGPAETDVGVERFLRGEVDVVEPGSRHLETLEGLPGARVRRYQELSVSFLGLQCSAPPLDDVRLRQAIAHAVDRAAFVAAAPTTRREAVGLLPPGLWGYSPRQKTLEHDLERARRLLLEAGRPAGAGLPALNLMIPENSAAARQLSEGIAANLGEVGVSVDIEPLSWAELGDRLDRRAGHMFLMAWIADLPDPDALLRSLFESGGSANYFAFQDARTQDLLESGANEPNPVRRAQIYRDLERRILELAPIVPLYHTLGIVATRESVHGFEPGPLGIANVGLERVWIDPRGPS